MPGGDRTGPEGLGPRTGRRLGYCSGYDSPGYTKGVPRGGGGYGRGLGYGGRGWGRGYGRGFWGRGRGFWHGYYPYYEPGTYTEQDKDAEKSYLEDIVKGLEEEIKAVKDRITELSKKKEEDSP